MNDNPLNFPTSTIHTKFVSKESLYRIMDVNSRLKDKFVQQIKRITWLNVISPASLSISGDVYNQINVIRIDLNDGELDDKVLLTIDQPIPHPCLFAIADGDYYRLAMAYKTVNNNNVTVHGNHYFQSNWTNQPDIRIIGNTVDQIYGNFLHRLEPKLQSDKLPLPQAIEQYNQQQSAQRQIDRLTKQIANEPNSAKRQELARQRAELQTVIAQSK